MRTWEVCRAANQRASAVDFMAGPLSVTITSGVVSPVAGSAQSTTRVRPSSTSAASMAALEGGDEVAGGLGRRDGAR